jgi:hypothetical protein
MPHGTVTDASINPQHQDQIYRLRPTKVFADEMGIPVPKIGGGAVMKIGIALARWILMM